MIEFTFWIGLEIPYEDKEQIQTKIINPEIDGIVQAKDPPLDVSEENVLSKSNQPSGPESKDAPSIDNS